jgi:phosphoglycolate phosphatase
LPPAAILYVGDSDIDMKTANAAGMYAVGVLWGFRTADELTRNGARVLIRKPLELLGLL